MATEWNGRMEWAGGMDQTQERFPFVRRRDNMEGMYEVDCIFYKIVVSKEQLQTYGIDHANLQKADTKAMRLERIERQRHANNIRRSDLSPPNSSHPKSIRAAPEQILSRTRGVCISLTTWFRSFGYYWF